MNIPQNTVDTGWNRPFYKYGKRQFSEALASRGVVKLGSLYGYTDTEKYGCAVGDPDEGRRIIFDRADLLHSESPEGWSPMPADAFVLKGKRIVAFNPVAQHTYRHPDAWLYCVSDSLSAEIRDGFCADACVKINDIVAFFGAIGGELFQRGWSEQQMIAIRCSYEPVRQPLEAASDTPPGMLKDPKFAYQREYRAVFFPKNLPIKDEILTLPELTQYCELIPETYK